MNEKGLAVKDVKNPLVVTNEQKELAKNMLAKGATDSEFQLFLFECARRGVHPLDRLIHFTSYVGSDGKKTVAFLTSIDYLRAEGESSREYRGQDAPVYTGEVIASSYHKALMVPETATVTVRRKDPATDEVYGISSTVYWNEFYPGDKKGFMWRKMPRVMLAKCAEAQALRKAFPRQLGGLYAQEEMEQAEVNNQQTIKPPQAKKVLTPSPVDKTVKPVTAEAVEPTSDPTGTVTPAQITLIHTLSNKANLKDDEYKGLMAEKYSVTTSKDLSKEQAAKFIDLLNSLLPSEDR